MTGKLFVLVLIVECSKGYPSSPVFEQTAHSQQEPFREHLESPGPIHTNDQYLPPQQYQHRTPVQSHQQSNPEQAHQQPVPVQPVPHNQPLSQQHHMPSYQSQPQPNSIPTPSDTSQIEQSFQQYAPYQTPQLRNQSPQQFQRQNASYPYQADKASYRYHNPIAKSPPEQPSHQNQLQHSEQSLPSNDHEHIPSNHYHQQKQMQQPKYVPSPVAVPQHQQNQLPHQQTKPDFGYTTQLKQVTNTVNSVPIPYMKYDKDESPVFHYGHDDLDKEYGDRKVVQGEFPYFVQLRTNDIHICGGALIRSPVTGKQVILTALHCLVTPPTSKLLLPKQITLRMGILGVDDSGQERKAAVILAHSAYTLFSSSKRPILNDIGMVIPDSEFNLNEHVQFINLPESNLPTQWHDVNIKGFGTGREAGHMETTKYMRTISVPVWDNEVCNKAYFEESGANLITDGHFCAAHRTGGLDSCQGDSGGPATTKDKGKLYLVGIVSWGKGCGKIAYPGVYVRVWSYLNWIKKTLFDFEINGVLPYPPKYPQ